jgi:hypothetical protein
MTRQEALQHAIEDIQCEARKAASKHRQFNSTHEAYAVILEELDEAWEEIKRNQKQLAVQEMTQVGAMAARFVAEFKAGLEVTDEP